MTSKIAIVFIDHYNDFLHPKGKLYSRLEHSLNKTDTIAHMENVLKVARANRIPLFYCMHQQTDDHSFKDWTLMTNNQTGARDNKVFRAGSFGAEYFKGIEPDFDNGDVVVSKHWNSSSFANTDLDYQLKQRGIRHLVFAGLVANSCLEATARYAYELGYEITMLSDVTAGFSDQARAAAADLIWQYFANRVTTTDEWVSGLSGTKKS